MAKSPTVPWLITPSLLLFLTHGIHCFFLPNATHLENILNRYQDGQPHSRAKRSISKNDQNEILMLHNKLRGEVYPSASNMEYMRWDEELERSAESWAHQCIWDHGPASLLPSIGQNLAVHWGRYRSPSFHVQSWYDEVKDYTYPYPHECNPWCPDRCTGPMCTHYTQVVWATTNKIGCAINVCKRMDVWGEVWENAVYLVCNYSPKGNWIGEAPYKNGRSCSECPPSYGGGCQANLCYKEKKEKVVEKLETDGANEVELQEVPDRIQPKPVKPTTEKKPTELTYMTQVIKCDTKMRDTCRGSTCNRYLCPAGCLNSKAKVFGFPKYESASSICRAAIHSGVLDNRGGLVDITRKGRSDFFVMSVRNGVQTLSKYKPSNGFAVSKVTGPFSRGNWTFLVFLEDVLLPILPRSFFSREAKRLQEKPMQTLDCYTTVEELCPFKKPTTHCPRSYCPAYCKNEPNHWATVYGTKIYADNSSICKAAVHAGVIGDSSGGYVDVMPVDKKKVYKGSLRNGIRSESLKTPREGKAFQIFAVRQ